MRNAQTCIHAHWPRQQAIASRKGGSSGAIPDAKQGRHWR